MQQKEKDWGRALSGRGETGKMRTGILGNESKLSDRGMAHLTAGRGGGNSEPLGMGGEAIKKRSRTSLLTILKKEEKIM